jgi:hypothetical protein
MYDTRKGIGSMDPKRIADANSARGDKALDS